MKISWLFGIVLALFTYVQPAVAQYNSGYTKRLLRKCKKIGRRERATLIAEKDNDRLLLGRFEDQAIELGERRELNLSPLKMINQARPPEEFADRWQTAAIETASSDGLREVLS